MGQQPEVVEVADLCRSESGEPDGQLAVQVVAFGRELERLSQRVAQPLAEVDKRSSFTALPRWHKEQR